MENTCKFTFRSKFTKIIGSDIEYDVYQKAFEKFCNLTEENALHILWSLTHDKETRALDDIGLFDGNSPENFIILRNELRYQYMEVHPNFLQENVPEEFQEAYDSLEKRTDTIVAVVVYQHCTSSVKYSNQESRSRIAFLLESSKENLQFGGIRSLNFKQTAADYLLPFCAEISSLFNVMNEKKNQSEKNTPLANLGSLLEDAGMELPFDYEDPVPVEEQAAEEIVIPVESKVTQPAQNTNGFRRVYAESVFMYKDVFASFVKDESMNALLEIGKLGFDLNEVMAKKEKIYNLISALQKKEDAEFLLSLATRELDN